MINNNNILSTFFGIYGNWNAERLDGNYSEIKVEQESTEEAFEKISSEENLFIQSNHDVLLHLMSAETNIFLSEIDFRRYNNEIASEGNVSISSAIVDSLDVGDLAQIVFIEALYEVVQFYDKFSVKSITSSQAEEMSQKYLFGYILFGKRGCYKLIDATIPGLADYCRSRVRNPNQQISLFFSSVLKKFNRQILGQKVSKCVNGSIRDFAESYSKLGERPKKLYAEMHRSFAPGLFKYYAGRFAFSIQNILKSGEYDASLGSLDPIKAVQIISTERILNFIDNLYEALGPSKYWVKQKDRFAYLASEYNKKVCNNDEFVKFNKLCVLTNKNYDLLIKHFQSNIVQEIEEVPYDPVCGVEVDAASLEIAIGDSPIQKYAQRVTRWLKTYKNRNKKIRKFFDKGIRPYQKMSASSLEQRWIGHGFSTKVDELLSGRYGQYSYKTDRGYAMIAELTNAVGQRQIGVISYAIDDNGVCYHRMWSKKNCNDLVTDDIVSLFNSIDRDDLNEAEPLEIDVSEENPVSQDAMFINSETGIASIRDIKNKCQIRVLKRFN